MNESKRQICQGLEILIPAAVIVACLELLWNTPLFRLPIYWLPVYSPIPAIFLNTIIHLVVTVTPILFLGWLLTKILRTCRVIPVFLSITALAYAFFMSSIFLRLLWEIRDDPVFYPALRTLTIGWILLLCLVISIGAVIILRSRSTNIHPAWPVTLGMSMVVGVTAVVLRWPLAPVWYLVVSILIIVVLHGVLWFLTRHWHPAFLQLAGMLLILTLIVTLGRSIWAGTGGPAKKPNIVVALWDAVRADRMSLYGYGIQTTPYAEKLAEHGVVFQRVHSTANYTFPSHVSLFTGLYNREHNLWFNPDGYQEFTNLPRELERIGYRTILISENPWVLSLYQGFDFYYAPFTRRMSVRWAKNPHQARPFPPFSVVLTIPSPFMARQVIDLIHHESQDWYKLIIDEYEQRIVEEQLVLRRRNQPLFIFLNWMNVHNRYFPGRDYKTDYLVDPYPVQLEYNKAIRYTDRRLEELVEVFHRSGVKNNTVFIVTADHGQLHGEHGLWGHGRTLFEPVIHVPLLISCGCWPERRNVSFPATQISLKPALLMLAKTGGVSQEALEHLITIFRENRGVVSETRSEEAAENGEYLRGFAYLTPDEDKLIYDPELKGLGTHWKKNEKFFFDLRRDQTESRNLFNFQTEVRERLFREYMLWMENLSADRKTDSEQKYPAGLEKQLRAMGYLK